MAYTTIAAHTGGNLWPSDYGASGTLGIICSRDFVADDSKSFQQGNGDSLTNEFVVTAPITVASSVPTYGAFSLPKTDASSPIDVRYTGVIFDVNGVRRDWLFAGFDLVTSLGDSISFQTWWNDNQQRQHYPYDTNPSTTQMNTAINAAFLNAAINQDYIIGAYSSFAAAITAITATGGTLVINQATTCSTNTTVPANITLRFTRKGSLTISNGVTATIVGPIEADAVPIFLNAVSGQGTISFAGNTKIKDFSPEWWGAVADGVTENRTFIHAMFAAMKTAGGGRWLLPANVDYLYTPTGSYSNSLDCFSQEASNITIEASGWSSILTIGGNFGARFGIPYQTQNVLAGTGTGPWVTPSFARFDAATAGPNTITLTTLADHALFAAGNVVYLESGDGAPLTGHPPASFEFAEIDSIDTGTGVITLKDGLRDSYDTTDASYEPRIVRLNVAPRNITLRNLRIRRSSGAFTVLDFENNRDVLIEDCLLEGLIYSAYCEGVEFRNNTFILSDPTLHTSSIDGGDAQRDQRYIGNTIHSQGAYGLIVSGATKNITVERNKIYGFSQDSASGIGIWMSAPVRTRPATGTCIINNSVFLDTTTASGIVVGNSSGAVISGNDIRGNVSVIGNAGIQLTDTMTGFRVADNTVEIGGSNGSALLLVAAAAADSITKGSIVNNTLHGPAFGVLFSNSSAGTILKNRFVGNDLAGTVRFRNFSYTDNTIDGIDTNDMRGTFTIADAATTSVVTFTAAWDDADYRVVVAPTGITGAPAAGANRILKIVKAAGSFTVHLEAAPGAGTSVSFDWTTSR